ncbi:uncharacterized protein LOC112272364 [Brachypodium distachyon]|uniref:uncharacterized protein LOC112272364 n=1 Tax=Brachypodium distachyon TaxID=15368 RepID=UPI000D0CB48C|nr:uncharacterized protein LOC112272364 [Brachypodium distachyon]|eukprot:XP_024318713.1 uncharacterized protein LOC112272364 [Brachypodium distachyon]
MPPAALLHSLSVASSSNDEGSQLSNRLSAHRRNLLQGLHQRAPTAEDLAIGAHRVPTVGGGRPERRERWPPEPERPPTGRGGRRRRRGGGGGRKPRRGSRSPVTGADERGRAGKEGQGGRAGPPAGGVDADAGVAAAVAGTLGAGRGRQSREPLTSDLNYQKVGVTYPSTTRRLW